ncbi:MAG: MFS transporter [Desulfuromonadales bacterium GWD2_61_12]|nr:MAG: MFS transporter [Desulfuromonadales bacterium GWC2_61_20]OGR32734.1 MAG: MFS transporter [Desulfuromonadales bacterium GWD2_61_12]HAD03174.1 MFS transporter [Desulfuromonas sp.]HBT83358.1 MFS transporter [Desulfuromonas sp.]
MSNLSRLYLFACLKMTLFPMAVITLFWKDEIGLSLTEIMLLQGGFSLASVLCEYPSGYLADRLGYRRTLTLATIIGIVGWAVYTVADSFAGVLLAEALLGACFAFISGSDSALLYESLRRDGREGDYARYDGRMNGAAQSGEAAGALFAGALYALSPLIPFLLQIAVWLVALLVVRGLVEAPPDHTPAPASHLTEALKVGRHALIETPLLRWGILYGTVAGLASFYPVWLIQPHMQQQGVPLTWFGPIWAGANLTVAVFALLSQRSRFHLGDAGLVWLCGVLCLLGYLGLGLWPGIWSFFCYYLLTAMRGLQGPLIRHHLQLASSRHNRASILSLKNFAFRLAFVVSGPLVGLAADRAGLAATFLGLALLFALLLLPLSRAFLNHLPKTS